VASWKLGFQSAFFLGLPILAFALWANTQITLNPQKHGGRWLALIAFLLAFLGTTNNLGQLLIQRYWAKAFQWDNTKGLYIHPTEGWNLRYPDRWILREFPTPHSFSIFISPSIPTPPMEISVTRRSNSPKLSLEKIVDQFLATLQKTVGIKVLHRAPFTHPAGPAYEIIYKTTSKNHPMENRVIFLNDEKNIYTLTQTASSLWSDRVKPEITQFFLSFRLMNKK